MKKYTREYYKLRNPENAGEYNEFYSSNNGTSQWGSMKQIKTMITRGHAGGYKGRSRTPFTGFEVIKVTESVTETSEVIKIVSES